VFFLDFTGFFGIQGETEESQKSGKIQSICELMLDTPDFSAGKDKPTLNSPS
jgi:hypothetical protein